MEIKIFLHKFFLLISDVQQMSSAEIYNVYKGGDVNLAPWGSFQTLAAILFSSGFIIRIGAVAVKGMRGEAPVSLISTLYDLLKVAAIFAVVRGIPWPSILGLS